VDAEAPPFGDDENLWNTFDITVGLDDSYDQPTDDDIQEQLENHFNAGHRHSYTAKRTQNAQACDLRATECWVLGLRT